VAGLILFTLADVSVTPTFDTTGLIMIIGSLVFDAFLGNIQEALFVAFPNISQVETKN
jgi:adenosine 3'-phospho 5'-phosphosulfate transporter B3